MPNETSCPRCNKTFTCGADAPDCACGKVELSDDLRRWLAEHYVGCLCGPCLRELAHSKPEAT